MTIQIDDRTPVIIGAGQFQMNVPDVFENALGPIDLTVKAIQAAFADTGAQNLAPKIDRLTAIRTFADSGPLFTCPFGTSKNMPRSLAERIGANPKKAIYSAIGGEQPQTQVFKSAKALKQGEASLAVICGGEAMATMKAAIRAGAMLDWSDSPENMDIEDEGFFPEGMPLHPEEMRHGLLSPIQFYAMMETARRLELCQSPENYRKDMAELFATFAKHASENPFSMFKEKQSAEDISKASLSNPLISDPYTKALIAKDGVNQAAAIVMTTKGQAEKWGIDPSKLIYLHGFAKTGEKTLIERPDPSYSPALKLALEGAMCCAGVKTEQISHADLYSCFPIVVSLSQEIMQAAPLTSLTLTGGLPFFGGPGNNYTLHGLAEMVRSLRKDQSAYGLVQGNGGFMSKHAVGIYSAQPPQFDMFERIVDFQNELETVPKVAIETNPEGKALLRSYSLSYKKGAADSAVVFLETKEGRHAIARYEGDASILNTLKKHTPLTVISTKRGNIARLV